MKRNLLIVLVVVLAGIIFQSCEKIENPQVDTKYVTLRIGFHGNNYYKLPEGGVIYTADEEIQVFFVNNMEETFKSEFSLSQKGNHHVGDTIKLFSKNPKQLIWVSGRMQVL